MEIPNLTQQEVLAELGVSYKTLRRLELDGKVRAVRISRKVVRYYRSDIQTIQSLKNEKEVN